MSIEWIAAVSVRKIKEQLDAADRFNARLSIEWIAATSPATGQRRLGGRFNARLSIEWIAAIGK